MCHPDCEALCEGDDDCDCVPCPPRSYHEHPATSSPTSTPISPGTDDGEFETAAPTSGPVGAEPSIETPSPTPDSTGFEPVRTMSPVPDFGGAGFTDAPATGGGRRPPPPFRVPGVDLGTAGPTPSAVDLFPTSAPTAGIAGDPFGTAAPTVAEIGGPEFPGCIAGDAETCYAEVCFPPSTCCVHDPCHFFVSLLCERLLERVLDTSSA